MKITGGPLGALEPVAGYPPSLLYTRNRTIIEGFPGGIWDERLMNWWCLIKIGELDVEIIKKEQGQLKYLYSYYKKHEDNNKRLRNIIQVKYD